MNNTPTPDETTLAEHSQSHSSANKAFLVVKFHDGYPVIRVFAFIAERTKPHRPPTVPRSPPLHPHPLEPLGRPAIPQACRADLAANSWRHLPSLSCTEHHFQKRRSCYVRCRERKLNEYLNYITYGKEYGVRAEMTTGTM